LTNFINDLSLLFQRLNWLNILDIFLVTAIIFTILQLISNTKAAIILRGVIILSIFLSILTSVVNLPAFNWLIKTTLPALLLAVPVIFAPELRRGLESIGRAGGVFHVSSHGNEYVMQNTIRAIVAASLRLSSKNHGALIVLQRVDNLRDYILTGVKMESCVTPELLLQIFYPNTPLHDGAVIIVGDQMAAAACVLPLSASGILTGAPERQMGLRHRAALGISEATDAIAVVVSEETGTIAVSHSGRMIRRLDAERLENILTAFYRPERVTSHENNWLRKFFRTGKRPGAAK
jgi:diadenylate cyclase